MGVRRAPGAVSRGVVSTKLSKRRVLASKRGVWLARVWLA